MAVSRQPFEKPTRLNEAWTMHFMSDVLSSGQRCRILKVEDVFSRDALASEVDTSLPASPSQSTPQVSPHSSQVITWSDELRARRRS